MNTGTQMHTLQAVSHSVYSADPQVFEHAEGAVGGAPMSKCIDTDWLDMTALSVTASDLEEEARPAPFRSRRGHLAMPCRRQARFSAANSGVALSSGCMHFNHATHYEDAASESGLDLRRPRSQ